MSAGNSEVVEALRKTLKERDRLHRENQLLRATAAEPIAIIGMACRYPGGVASPEDLWQLVADGRDGISEFPTDRGWDLERIYNPDPENPGTSYTCEGGFLEKAGAFDAEFFSISPREALIMDPQERLLLESCWEALEAAGIGPTSLKKSQTGVFAGVNDRAYGPAAGMTSSIVSGRISYALGLEGPAISIDTACSSSLVAMHLASQALRQGECTLALASGVTVLATPGAFISFSAQRGLSADGRCKSFAEAADGTGWGEGVGVLVLERLSDAKRNRHSILALLKGSAVNQDGASNGLTAPNGPSQERVIRQALASAGLETKDVDAVEGHGTGTTLGDPIEARALLATYGQDRERPLRLGSLKSNIGHTQAAAGVGGVIKMTMAMQAGVLPKTLHVDAPSSKVDWEVGEIELLTESVQWDTNGKPRRAGVSSFGISGTNAHVILEQAPEPESGVEEKTQPSGPIPLVLSAKTEPALTEAMTRLSVHLEANPDLDRLDIAYSLATTRAELEHRAVAFGEPPAVVTNSRARDGKLAYLLTGQGSQRPGMGRELYGTDPVFAAAFDRVCEQLDQYLDKPLKEIVFTKGKKAATQLAETTYAQPALFAIELALHEALAKRGLTPDVLSGHSIGEIAAAHIADVFDLANAAKLVAARGRLMGALPGGGAMAAIEATEAEVSESIEGKETELSIAAINGPTSVVISGTEDAVEEIRSHWEDKGRKTKRLAVSHAFHSLLMEPMLSEFAEIASSLAFSEPQIPLISNLSGELLTPEQATDPAYWVSHVREPVRFADGIETLRAQGASTYLEIGPDPVLLAMARECLGEAQDKAAFIPTLREGRKEADAIATAIGSAFADGAKVDWGAFFKGTGAKRVPLPTYPFQRSDYWFVPIAHIGELKAAGFKDPQHPLLIAGVEDPSDGGLTLIGRLSLTAQPWLADHVVDGIVLLPGTAFLELALRAAEQVEVEIVEELTLEVPLVLSETATTLIQVSVSGPGEDGTREVAIHSRQDDEEVAEWTRHASGFLSESPMPPPGSFPAWPPEGAEAVQIDYLYDLLAEHGLQYGPAFQGLTAAWRDDGRIYVEVSLPEELALDAERYGIHPALLDAALHGVALAEGSQGGSMLPFAWRSVSLQAVGARDLRAVLAVEADEVALQIADGAGAPVATVGSLALRPLATSGPRAVKRPDDGLLALNWHQVPLVERVDVLAGVEVFQCEPSTEIDLPAAARAAAQAALEAVQRWLAGEPAADSRLAIVSRGAVAAAEGEIPDPAAAAIWGLIRSAQSEHPGRLALIDTDGSDASQEALPTALALGAEEPQLALRDGMALAPRLGRVKVEEDAGDAAPIDPQRTVLVTGATGGLGALAARHLAERHGARHLLLLSRSGPAAEGAAELRGELEELGAEVRIAACDVSDRAALASALSSIPSEHPLGAVIHCAGTIADGTVETLGREQLEDVFAPKADAAWSLHELTQDADLAAFVLFSSTAGTLGSPGQANYAAANVFLDALAQKRQAEGLVATAIAWGLWAREGGMTSNLTEADLERMRRGGAEPLSDERGMSLLDRALAADRSALLAVPLDTSVLKIAASAGALPPIFSGLVRGVRWRSVAKGSLAVRLTDFAEAEQESFVLDLVRGEVAGVLGHASAEEIEPERAFQELGFDSLAAIELRNRLDLIAGVRLPATVVFDYPNSAALARRLLSDATADGVAEKVAVKAQASDEPIAIVGMACRFPGDVSSPDELWQLLAEGREGISTFPSDRGWDLERVYDPELSRPGTSYTREGGFLDDVAGFDSAFFGISPREAFVTDPQQRLLLEVAWEALEDAGIEPVSLRGGDTGVFAGVMYQDYGLTPGMTSSIVSGRLAYTLGLEGPAISVDTACSSSLVALHLAAQALRGGECTLALAGGVTVLSTPNAFIDLSRQGVLSPDGRSKSFAEAADGAGFSEGIGVLTLKRLSEAEREGFQILSVLRGSAVNQDGASNGLTAPNGPSQERVIRQALANARLDPRDVDVVEAHGTGTTLGDPIEAGALLATYGQDREQPLKLGSIKSNIGHTQAAAGVAGVIKMTLAMREGVLPKTLHVDAPSSKVEWEAGKIELLTEQARWEANGRPRLAGISSFGISGTNAHVILEEPPAPKPATERPDAGDEGKMSMGSALAGQVLLPLSAKAERALPAAAERLGIHLNENPDVAPEDVAYSLATTRSAFEQRAAVLGADRDELLAALASLAAGEDSPAVVRGSARTERRPVFVFPGQGSQWEGMGLDLIEASPAFAAKLSECEEALSPYIDWSVTDVLKGAEGAPPITQIEVVQPTLFAVMASLAELWRSCGVHPAAVAGHSQGEIVAAHVAGGLSLADAAMLAAVRSRIISKLAGQGGMVSVTLSATELESRFDAWAGRIEVAAHNGPSSTILSGDREALDRLLAQCEQEDVRAREVPAAIASHSAYVEALREEVLDSLAPISPQSSEIPFHSTVTGGLLDTAELDAAYWYRNLRETVRFEQVTRGLIEQGQRAFIEVSPHPVFAMAVGGTIEAALPDPSDAAVLGTLRRDEHGPRRFALSLAEAYSAGATVDWQACFAGGGVRAVKIPTYPFQRERYWLGAAPAANDVSAVGLSAPEHPLLGAAVELAGGEGEGLLLTGRLSLATHPWLADHAVGGVVLLPATVFLELALRAGLEAGVEAVEELTMLTPLVLSESEAVVLQIVVGGVAEDGGREIAIHSRPAAAEGEWIQNASGTLSERPVVAAESLDVWPPEGAEPIDIGYVYDRLAELDLEYGPAFHGLTAAWRDDGRVYAQVALPEQVAHEAAGFNLHPVLLDSALQAAMLAKLDRDEPGPGFPFSWREVALAGIGANELRVCLTPGEGKLRMQLADGQGSPLATVDSLLFRQLDSSQMRAPGGGGGDLLTLDWQKTLLDERDEASAAVELLRCETGEQPPGAGAARALVQDTLRTVQQWLADGSKADVRLAFVTQDAITTEAGESPDPIAAAIWGLVRSAQSEHPGRFALIDTDGGEESEATLSAVLEKAADEPQLALRQGEALVPRLARLTPAEPEEATLRIDPERTVLISGATDGSGALAARHLVERHGARHLLLLVADVAEELAAKALAEELEEAGAEVEVAACDLADRDSLQEVLDSIPVAHPLGAVVHCATLLADSLVESMTAEQVDLVFATKVEGAWNLHELSAGADLSAFVLFSSIVGTLGSPGQGNYAAANAFLDALAQERRAEGSPATSIAWGLWEHQTGTDLGVREADVERLRRGGIEALTNEQGLALFDAALATDRSLALALRLDTSSLRALASSAALPPIFSGLVRVPGRRSAATASGSLATKLATMAEAEREGHVLELIRSEVASVLGHASAQDVDPGRAFQELGFESLTAVELRNRLSATTGLRLPATVVFDYPSSASLAEHILAEATAGGAQKQVVVRAQTSEEPIAIVGMACRYPGGIASPADLWDLVAEGRDAVTEFPSDRGWDLEHIYNPDPDNPGTSYAREGGFLPEAGEFDAEFFSISPREAIFMDPQERLLLESCWEALEDPGIDPLSLRKSETGVFAGVAYQDYGPSPVMSSSVVSGRVSYALGLEGPAITVNTACSSSLVAIHLAAQALRGGECSLALAGGVTVLSTPSIFIDFSRQRGLAPDGRCKSFAEAADGAGFSDGVGVLALERLADAERAGHPVYGLLKGSAVNQDGASNGLTAPNGPSQERVIRQALANARLQAKDVDAVEAHGTGTTLGDPIEAGALLATYGQDRDIPLRLGSLKSNIGHTQAAAGVGGVIKMAMAMREGVLPKTLHVDAPSSKVEWEAGKIELLTEQAAWQANGHPRRAGISAFGISGTNAHLILEEPPAPAGPRPKAGNEEDGGEASSQALPAQIPLTLSARAEPALTQVADRLLSQMVENPDLDPTDVAYSLATTRSAFEHRVTVLGSGRDELLASLGSVAQGNGDARTARGRARQEHRPVFLFPGQGAQAQRMAMGLIEASPAFARQIAACEQALAPHVDWSLTEVLAEAEARWLDRLDIVQPALFAVMVSLAGLWRQCGVEPQALVGHSQGEIAAAHVAGALSLEDAALIVAKRGQAMAGIAGRGGMLSVSLAAEQLSPYLDRHGERVSLAAINGPASLVLSGEPEALEEIQAACEGDGVRAQAIAVDYAAHSPQIEALEEDLLAAFAPIGPRDARIPLYSTVTGEQVDGLELGPEYWYRNLRQTVLLEPVLRSLLDAGRRAFIEIGPHPVLAFGTQETIEDTLADPGEAILLSSLRREEDEASRFALSLAEAHSRGVAVEWGAYFKGAEAKRVALPTYPFQRERYWLDSALARGGDQSAGGRAGDHPLLGTTVELAGEKDGRLLLTGNISTRTHPWLADHLIAGRVVLPGTALLELALHAGAESGAETLEELSVEASLIVPEQGTLALQVTLADQDEAGSRELAIHSRSEDEDGGWVRNAIGSLSSRPLALPEPLADWPPIGAERIETDDIYDHFADAGVENGPLFQGLTAVWRDGERIYAEASLPEGAAWEAPRFSLHPALLSAAMLGIGAARREEGEVELPAVWRGVGVQGRGASTLRLRIDPQGEGYGIGAFDANGAAMLVASSVALRPLELGELRSRQSHGMYRVGWQPVPVSGVEALDQATAEIPPGQAGGDVPEAARATAERVLALVREWVGEEREGDSRLTLITHNAIGVAEGDATDPAAAMTWGLVRAAISEYPGRFALIDTDDHEDSRAALGAALPIGAEEPQLALRQGRAFAPRLSRIELEDEAGLSAFDPDATVLIGAGVEGRGELIARHLREVHGVEYLLHAGSEELADRTALQELLESIPAEHPLGAVIHLADPLGEGLLESLDSRRLEAAVQSSAEAAWNLHELTSGLGLSRFLLFSSLTGTLGGTGQGPRAAIGAFLDALAVHRRERGLPATALTWGTWGEGTGTADRNGVVPTPAARALEYFDAACGTDQPVLAPVQLRRSALRALAGAGALPSVLRGLVTTRSERAPDALARSLASLAEDERETAVLDFIQTQIAEILGHGGAAAVDPDRTFVELGVDSLSAMELRNRLGAAIGLQIPISVLASQPTVREVAGYVAQRLDPAPVDAGEEKPSTETFVSLLGGALEQGKVVEFMGLLTAAAEFRPAFESALPLEESPAVVRLADGDDSPSLILMPSLVAMSGPQEYVRLAQGFRDDRQVWAAPLAGFQAGEPLPADLAAVTQAAAEAIQRSQPGSDFVLAGYSSGGWVAHALAARLEAQGVPPKAVVLLDSPSPSVDVAQLLQFMFALDAGEGEQTLLQLDDARLTAMARYFDLFRQWTPEDLRSPVLMVRASEQFGATNEQVDSLEAVVKPLETVEVPGNHVTMMGEHADTTSQAVQGLIRAVADSHNGKG
jgi:acyl transferase domain-containing protein/thioesterase domain-containing protein/acyl carrier protein